MADFIADAICVCICTYKRPELLQRSLEALAEQTTNQKFTYSIVVADNDYRRSAENKVAQFKASHHISVVYCVEDRPNIARARNKALANASGDFIAFIDDDEFPVSDWLSKLHACLQVYGVDGVLGPVRPRFEYVPADWLIRGKFCERPEFATGTALNWRQTRTGNALLRFDTIAEMSVPFREEFGNGGEDQDFFRRLMERGHQFVWCNEAVVYEVVPPERCKRRYLLRRALLRGQNERLLLSGRSIFKSLFAVPVYAATLLVAWMFGHHVFMNYAIRLCDHVGKLLVAIGVKPVRGNYLSGQEST